MKHEQAKPLPLPVVLEPIDPATLEPETMDVLRQLGLCVREPLFSELLVLRARPFCPGGGSILRSQG